MKSPSLTTKTRWLSTVIHPEGRRSASVSPSNPTRFSHPTDELYPASAPSTPGAVNFCQKVVLVMSLNKRTNPISPPIIPIISPHVAMVSISGPTGVSGKRRAYNPQRINAIPPMPAIPNPGITTISITISAIPAKIINTSVMVANLAINDAPNDNAKHTNPIEPGMPQPGLWSSNKIPRNPNVVSRDATTGFVKNRTMDSDQFSLVFLISASFKSIDASKASNVSCSSSAI